ncbi:MAG: HDOD domain-containing protein [Oscillospiraceae bacterium]
MATNVVRQAIMGLDKTLLGYELVYEDGDSSLFNKVDSKAASTIEDFLTQLDSEKFVGGEKAFITFTPNLLLRGIPKIFKPGSLVIQIGDSTLVHPDTQKQILELRKSGYAVAVNNFEFSPRYLSLLDTVDYIKLDMHSADDSTANIVNIGRSFKKKVIATHVDTNELYVVAQKAGCEYFQGAVVAQAMSSKVARMDHLQSNFFQLMIAVTKDEPDVDEIASIISRDVTLAFSVIKMVNSAYFALRNRVRSVKQALVVLGLGQLKQWVYLLSFHESDDEMSAEMIKTSFLRANFCSELAVYARNVQIAKSDAYLMGMFSTLGLLMEVPIEVALKELPVIDEVREALLNQTGPYAALYDMVLAYERADWNETAKCAQELGMSANLVSQKYFECVEYVNNIWATLLHPYKGDDSLADDDDE